MAKVKDKKANALRLSRKLFNRSISQRSDHIGRIKKEIEYYEREARGPNTNTDFYFQALNHWKGTLRRVLADRAQMRIAMQTISKLLKGRVDE